MAAYTNETCIIISATSLDSNKIPTAISLFSRLGFPMGMPNHTIPYPYHTEVDTTKLQENRQLRIQDGGFWIWNKYISVCEQEDRKTIPTVLYLCFVVRQHDWKSAKSVS